MLKKTMTYTDYNGIERTEDFYFNLSKAEILDMQLSTEGGYDKLIEKIVNAKDVRGVIGIVKNILLKSYGVKSDDGKRFVKSPEITAEFEQSPVYSDIYLELATNPDACSDFVNELIPSDLRAQLDKSDTSTTLSVTD